MFVRATTTPNSPRKSVKVVESVREGLKVRQIMVHHVGIASSEAELEKLKCLGWEWIAQEQLRRVKQTGQEDMLGPLTEAELQKTVQAQAKKKGRIPQMTLRQVTAEDQLSLSDLVEETRIVEGIHEIAGHVYDQLGYSYLLSRKIDQELLKDLVLMRVAQHCSKHKAQQLLQKRYAKIHNLDAIYRLMDRITPKIDAIKTLTFQKTQQLIPETIDILFFDCTTLHFESTNTDGLREYGYSKDHRFNTTQVVLALATNRDGLPIGYELFEGNKAEVHTLLNCLDTWKKSFQIASVCFVADRAMMSEANLIALEQAGHHYIIAAKLRCLPEVLKKKILNQDHYQQRQLGEQSGRVAEFNYSQRRLIVSYKEDRAHRDRHQREQILKKIKHRLGTLNQTKNLITNHGVKKYTTTDATTTQLDSEKIQQDEQWDGLHGIITNIKSPKTAQAFKASENIEVADDGVDAQELIARYARLWKIEESFRINKHTLSMRPIYHFKPERIRAHIAICYMAYAVLRQMQYRVQLTKKISIDLLLDELLHVQASIYLHLPSKKRYRLPGHFSQNASKIYHAFHVTRCLHAQVLI